VPFLFTHTRVGSTLVSVCLFCDLIDLRDDIILPEWEFLRGGGSPGLEWPNPFLHRIDWASGIGAVGRRLSTIRMAPPTLQPTGIPRPSLSPQTAVLFACGTGTMSKQHTGG